ncbi:MAG TPA: hypothetical protein VK190_03455 [Pseudoneobacillus sp.]|nr:hypothetical protein [Pseudoneobacillus sp.]
MTRFEQEIILAAIKPKLPCKALLVNQIEIEIIDIYINENNHLYAIVKLKETDNTPLPLLFDFIDTLIEPKEIDNE